MDKEIRKIIKQDYTIEYVGNNTILLFNGDYKCPYSDRTHDRKKAYINVRQDGYYFKCGAESCKPLKKEVWLCDLEVEIKQDLETEIEPEKISLIDINSTTFDYFDSMPDS